jgi:hypothetical protein
MARRLKKAPRCIAIASIVLGVSALLTLFYACRMPPFDLQTAEWLAGVNPDNSGYAYWIGDVGPAGGLIFYVDVDDLYPWTYLEVWTGDEPGMYKWKDVNTATPTGTEIGTGYANTYNDMTGSEHPAAEAARDAGHGGKDDWSLPSKDELNAIWLNIVDDGAGNNSGVGGFALTHYWSSSESTATNAWTQYFNNGNQGDASKAFPSYLVRVVRTF